MSRCKLEQSDGPSFSFVEFKKWLSHNDAKLVPHNDNSVMIGDTVIVCMGQQHLEQWLAEGNTDDPCDISELAKHIRLKPSVVERIKGGYAILGTYAGNLRVPKFCLKKLV